MRQVHTGQQLEPLGLTAITGHVIARRYGRHADDQWSVDELLRLARTGAAPGPATASPSRRPRTRRSDPPRPATSRSSNSDPRRPLAMLRAG